MQLQKMGEMADPCIEFNENDNYRAVFFAFLRSHGRDE